MFAQTTDTLHSLCLGDDMNCTGSEIITAALLADMLIPSLGRGSCDIVHKLTMFSAKVTR